MFPSDYPHERVYGEFLKDIPELLARPELSDAAKQKILYDNAKEFYRIWRPLHDRSRAGPVSARIDGNHRGCHSR